MNDVSTEPRTVVVERELAHPPEKVWRVLTLPHFIEEWLGDNAFRAEAGHRFDLGFEWGDVNCRVLEVELHRKLSYTWASGELDSVVRWTLTPTTNGTKLTMEQTGFPDGQPRYYNGAQHGWPKFFDGIEQVLARID